MATNKEEYKKALGLALDYMDESLETDEMSWEDRKKLKALREDTLRVWQDIPKDRGNSFIQDIGVVTWFAIKLALFILIFFLSPRILRDLTNGSNYWTLLYIPLWILAFTWGYRVITKETKE